MLKDFPDLARWNFQGPTGLDGADNYAGPRFSSYFVGIGQHRDSEALDRTNFKAALARLEEAAKGLTSKRWYEIEDERGPWGGPGTVEPVKVIRQGNWACGWAEIILVHKAALPVLKELQAIKEDLDAYPVLDEEAMTAEEDEENFEAWQTWGQREAERHVDAIASDGELNSPEELEGWPLLCEAEKDKIRTRARLWAARLARISDAYGYAAANSQESACTAGEEYPDRLVSEAESRAKGKELPRISAALNDWQGTLEAWIKWTLDAATPGTAVFQARLEEAGQLKMF